MAIKLIHTLAEARALGLTEGYVSKAVDTETKKIVGYIQGAGFDEQAINAIADNINQYDFVAPWEFVAHGVSLAAVFVTLGLGLDYAEEWGDYGELLKLLRVNPEEVDVVRVHYNAVEKDEIRAVVEGLVGA